MKTNKLCISILLLTSSFIANAQLKVWQSGMVGIGTTSSISNMVHVKSVYGNADLVLETNNGYQWDLVSSTGGGFALYQISAATNRLFANSSGNIGIGSDTPSEKLMVAGSILVNTDNTFMGADAGGNSRLGFAKKYGNYPVIAAASGVPIIFGNWSTTNLGGGNVSSGTFTEYVRITGGNVGIGTGTPGSYKLYVVGSAYCTGTWVPSDIRFKKNIKPIEQALEKIMKLNGKTYEFKREEFPTFNFNKGINTGIIAQELKEVLPDAVKLDSNGYYSVNYDALIPVLIEAMKEQNTKINSLESQVLDCCKNQSTPNTNNKFDNLNQESQISSDATSVTQSILYQNNPNPFGKETVISYFLPETTQNASLMIFDMQGAFIKSIAVSSYGKGSLTIAASSLKAGMYFYSLIADSKEVGTKKMIITAD